MKIVDTPLPGMLLLEPKIFGDDRGFFLEMYHLDRYRELGIEAPFVQDNLSRSVRGTLRGLHFQEPLAQGKLVTVLEGEVFDVAVDVRRGSPAFGQWFGVVLSSESGRQLWIPPGFAHGFCVTSSSALFFYKCTAPYNRETEQVIAWNDPALAIDWPAVHPILSLKDQTARPLAEAAVLPRYCP